MAKKVKSNGSQHGNPFNESEALLAADATAAAAAAPAAPEPPPPPPPDSGGFTPEQVAFYQQRADERTKEHAAAVAADAANGKTVKSPRERFLSLAAKRTQKVLTALTALSRCGNRKQYEYTEAEARKIIGAVVAAYDLLVTSFDPDATSRAKSTFTL